MARIGLAVPPITVSTETYAEYHENGGELPEDAWNDMMEVCN